MKNHQSRRKFLRNSLAGAMGGSFLLNSASAQQAFQDNPGYKTLDKILAEPVLDMSEFKDPLLIETLELLKYKDNILCRIRTKNGAEGISVSHIEKMAFLYPVFSRKLKPVFMGKDLRNWEQLMEEAYLFESNYKLQGLALWIPLATIEFAVLDLLGRLSAKPLGRLLNKIYNPDISVYRANNFRGKSPEESLDGIKKQVAEYEARALKFKIGGRMRKDYEYPAGRTEKLIPMVRKAFGDDMVIYADSNGSYTLDEAIRMGRLMEDYNYDFYEEPVPFDMYEETKKVTESLNIPVAGGEQEPSMNNFRWLLANHGLDVVQPDLFYFGGMIRSMKVAKMAEALGKVCTPHISGDGLGYLYMMHFVSAIPNAGPYHEFKGFNSGIPFECPTSPLKTIDGKITVPTGPGLGITIDPDFIEKHTVIS